MNNQLSNPPSNQQQTKQTVITSDNDSAPRGKTKAKRAVAIKAIDSYPTGSAIGGITIVAETVNVTNHFHF